MKEFSTTRAASSIATESAIELGAWQVMTTIAAPAGDAAPVKQIHGGNIVPIDAAAVTWADGIVLDRAGVRAAIATADCAPVVITSGELALVLHASRKSLVRGLLDNATTYIDPVQIDHIYVGPHISEYRFSFTEEERLLQRFRERYPQAIHFHKGKMYVSLRKALRQIFHEWGVHEQKVQFDGRCTYDTAYLPSYRRWLDGGKLGELGRLWTIVGR